MHMRLLLPTYKFLAFRTWNFKEQGWGEPALRAMTIARLPVYPTTEAMTLFKPKWIPVNGRPLLLPLMTNPRKL